jgi:uncharacterized protein HemX
METNRSLQFNLGMFNVPTLVGIVGLGLMVYQSGQKQERQDARLDAIEINRTARSAEVNTMLQALTEKTSPIDNITYRLTVVEQGIADANRRIDRQSDSMQAIRGDIAGLSTSIEVLRQIIDARLPQRTENGAGLRIPPKT